MVGGISLRNKSVPFQMTSCIKTSSTSLSVQLHLSTPSVQKSRLILPNTHTDKRMHIHALYMHTAKVVEQVSEFLDQAPFEVVVLDFNHFYDMTEDSHAHLGKRLGVLKSYNKCLNMDFLK